MDRDWFVSLFLYVILGAIHQPGTQRQLGSLVRIVHPKLAEDVLAVGVDSME